MKICGLQKTTLLDFPGHVAATVFTGGCDFRCPFCHNSELLDGTAPAVCTEEEFFQFLSRRSGILEGVAVTGGEPTLQPDLASFLSRIRETGLKIKLDTNGARPDILKKLCGDGLIDYVAMDIKSCPERYPLIAGVPALNLRGIDESVRFLLNGAVDFEFRTTVVRELHRAEDFEKIGAWISGAPRYFLQNFTDSGHVLRPVYTGCTKEKLSAYLALVKPFVGMAALRGVD